MPLFKKNKNKKDSLIRNYSISNFKWGNGRYNENFKSLEESGLIIKRISETIKNDSKEQKDRFLSMLLGTLAASILGNVLAQKGVIRAVKGVKICNVTSSVN